MCTINVVMLFLMLVSKTIITDLELDEVLRTFLSSL